MATRKSPPSATAEAPVDPRLFVASVEKAMRVLGVFDREHRRLTLAEIATRTALGRSATQRFVYTLHQLGYLERDPDSRHYRLATRVLELAKGMLDGHALLERGRPVLAELARTTGETVSWVELDGDEIVIVANVPSTHVTRVDLPVGTRFAALPSSSGQVLLWGAGEPRIAQMLARLDPPARRRLGPRSAATVVAMLAAAQRAGYSMTEKSQNQHGLSISAPVRGVGGDIVAAINVSTLASRHDAAAVRRDLLPLLLQACRAASV